MQSSFFKWREGRNQVTQKSEPMFILGKFPKPIIKHVVWKQIFFLKQLSLGAYMGFQKH